ncbi:MAG: hypothetical protein H7289_08335, partial [Mucilaginibacter sp.]|nr:hypothetical protein [Mucilaginibacter sp.]
IGQVEEKEGILKLKESDGQVGMITTGFDLSGKLIVRTLYQRQGGDQHWTAAGIGGWNNWFCFGDHTEVAGMGTNWLMFYNWASINVLDAAPLLKSTNKVITDKWRHAAYWYDGANIKGQQDDTIITMTAPDVASKLSLRTLDNDQWDNFAFITVSKFIDVEPVVSLGEEKKN